VARLYPRKRVDDLLEAAALLRQRIAGVQFRIIGDGPEASRLRALHDRLALGESAVFLGPVDRDTLALEYSRARCFCLPTVQEGFGLVFAEAMAAGLPIVACRAAAVPEVVQDGETGILVPPRTPAAIAAALERMLDDDGMRKEMGMAGRRRVEAFDLVPVARRFLEALPA
jgi:glycosyltransferase involved in cell wall biosynthesis